MTSLTLATLLVIVYGGFNKRGYGVAIALGGATAAGAAIAVGGIAVPTYYAISIGAAVILGADVLRRRRPGAARRPLPPGVPLLLVFLAWSTVLTLVAPVFFSGLKTVVAKGDSRLLAGFVTPSNVAQIGYLALGICVVVFIARSPYSRPELLGLTVCTTVVLSFWRFLHGEIGVPFPEGVFDNSPTLAFIETAPGGGERFRGILSEPSSLAASCLIAVSYGLSRATRVGGWRRAGLLAVVAAGAYMGAVSTSATFVVASVVVALVAVLILGAGFLLRRVTIGAFTAVALCAAFVAALWLLPQAADAVQQTVDDKVSSSSYSERSGADDAAYETFLDTYGLGVGLGSSRASSYLPGLLATTGIVGTLLYIFAVAGLVSRSVMLPDYRPVIWALLSLLVLKLIAGPDLSDPSGVLWTALGLLSHGAMQHDGDRCLLEPERGAESARILPTQASR